MRENRNPKHRRFRNGVQVEAAMGHAFTLIELLIVVAMLALLVAVLLPTLRKAREQAKRTACAANLNEISKAVHMFLDANGGRFPQGVNVNINLGGRQGTNPSYQGPKPLNPHLNLPLVADTGAEVFRCPSDRGGGIAPNTYFEFYGSSYHTNQLLIGQTHLFTPAFGPCKDLMGIVSDNLPGINVSQISNDSKLILIGDGGWMNTWHSGSSQRIEWHRRPCSHNIAFMDGHVDFVRIRKGLHVTPTYTVIPFKTLMVDALACQQEVGCE